MDRDADFSELENGSKEPGAGVGDSANSDIAAAQQSSGELEQLRRELAEANDKYLRALAEFENYKKRAIKERSELLKYQGERILVDLLEVVDNLELALKHASADPAKLGEGVELIHKKFIDTLGKWEVRSASGVGQDFDPTRYEAVSRVQVDDMKPGTIVSELRKAYLYKDKLIRVGQVVLAEAVATDSESANSGSDDKKA